MGINAITFRSADSLSLHGILHTPDVKARSTGIIILSPGIKSRVAPHRLYVKMSRCFAELGFKVFRFDPEGMGDSEGEVSENLAADVYGSIQVGRFVSNTVSAMDWMEKECGVKRFILTGLCGGAITGLLTGAGDARVDSLLGLGIPVALDGSNVDRAKYMTKGQLECIRKGYLRKISDPKAWVRLLSFKSDYRMILKSIGTAVKRHNKNTPPQGTAPAPAPPSGGQQQTGNFNPHFPAAFSKMVDSRKVCLIFSEADRLYWEFEEKFMTNYREQVEKKKQNIEIHVIKNANHIFSDKDAQKQMLKVSSDWLRRLYKTDV